VSIHNDSTGRMHCCVCVRERERERERDTEFVRSDNIEAWPIRTKAIRETRTYGSPEGIRCKSELKLR